MRASTSSGATTGRRLRAAAGASALVVLATGLYAVAETIPAVSCSRAHRSGFWQTFNAPTFLSPIGVTAGQAITAYSVDPGNALNVIVTNGNSLQVSHDGGCSWNQAIRLDQAPSDPQNIPLSGTTTHITGVYIPPKGHTYYATAEELDTGQAVGRPHVLISASGGPGTWHLGDSGLPPVGHPLILRGAPTSSRVLYLSFSATKSSAGQTCPPAPLPCPTPTQAPSSPGVLWGSTDGGSTWGTRADATDLRGVSSMKYLSVDDDDASGRTLWVVAGGVLLKSINGGNTFVQPDGLDQSGFTFTAVESIDKGKFPNPVKLVAFSDGTEMIRYDTTKGWVRSHQPFGSVESVAQRPDGDIAVATAPENGAVSIYRIFGTDFKDYDLGVGADGKQAYKLTFGWEPISPDKTLRNAAMLSSATGAGDGRSTFYLREPRAVDRFLGSNRTVKHETAAVANLGDPPPVRGLLSPAVTTVNLKVGKKKTVNYTLVLPSAPTPLDVYFLIDDSGSMAAIIEDLKQNLARVAIALNRAGVDLRMGVGLINVQPSDNLPTLDDVRTPLDEGPRPLYERLRKIGPVDTAFFQALGSVDATSNSGDEAQLESLWQSIVGDGLSYLSSGFGALTGYDIKPGQQAGFRDQNIIKVIVHATDEEFSTNIKGGHNTFEPVANVLNNAGVKQIGLSQGVEKAQHDLEKMARLTGTLAPAGGVDCDGDHIADIRAGQPLVCGNNYGLDTTLVNLLKSLNDRQVVSIQANPSPALARISRTAFNVDAHQPQRLTFSVTYSCVGLQPDAYEVNLDSVLRGVSVAKAVATVNCGGFPPPPRISGQVPVHPIPQPQPAQVVVAPVNPLPQAQSQIQTQLNPQAGMADQEQEQLQVAVADNDIGPTTEELAMSRLPWAGAAGMMFAGAAAYQLRRRSRTAVARARL